MGRIRMNVRSVLSATRDAASRFFSGVQPSGGAFPRLRIAGIVDEFTRACLSPEVTWLDVDARGWRVQLPAFRPQILFVESAWRGVRDSWKRRLATYPDHSDDTLHGVLRWCKRNGVPTVFWNKEDPVHFERFIARARLFDFVFTTEEECIGAYRREGLSHDRLHTLLFAAQPTLHHPPRTDAKRENVVCFAGSYGESELAERRQYLEALLDAGTAFDLRILDRNWKATGTAKAYPERYRPYLRPGVDYRELARLQQRYKVFLNVNAVRTSRTMFSRRVFELLASGAAIVSSPNAGITELFGDTVAIAATREQAMAAIQRLLDDTAHFTTVTRRGIEQITTQHTYANRLRQISSTIGLSL